MTADMRVADRLNRVPGCEPTAATGAARRRAVNREADLAAAPRDREAPRCPLADVAGPVDFRETQIALHDRLGDERYALHDAASTDSTG